MVLIKLEQGGLLLNSRRDSLPASLLPFLQLFLFLEDWGRRDGRTSGEISTVPLLLPLKSLYLL